MTIIKGNIRQIIFQSESGFLVALFKVKEAQDELKDIEHKTITITGTFANYNDSDIYLLKGEYVKHDRYGYQFQVFEYEHVIPEGKDALIEFLASPLIKGCGLKTAEAIVDTLGNDALSKIKEDINNLYLVPNMTTKRAQNIYTSVLGYSSTDDMLLKLKEYGFSISESTKIVKKYQSNTLVFLEENMYLFKDLVAFDKLDRIYKDHFDSMTKVRIKECILEGMSRLSDSTGDTYYSIEDIVDCLKVWFQIVLETSSIDTYLGELLNEDKIVIEGDKIFLMEYYDMERSIADSLYRISLNKKKIIPNILDEIHLLEDNLGVVYNECQREAIKNALESPISIISGGPGTGKTTIVNAITKIYIDYYRLTPINIISNIALLAPTGRAAKKLSLSTSLPAMTIHRYLKWNKESNEFAINEYNKNYHKLIIIDETSMIDTFLLYSLLNGITDSAQIIFVGDTFQLPSVRAGEILDDLVSSNKFSFTELETIYRQSNNSYIPILAKEIKEKELDQISLNKTDDYNFIPCQSKDIKEYLKQIIMKYIERDITVDDIQILAPMYKGENGIDNLNIMLQNLFNPPDKNKKEYKYLDVIFRENDKVLQLVNNPDCNVYNGDIGYIEKIEEKSIPRRHVEIIINFDGNRITYGKEDLLSIKHAYAMTIHKSQGSEFPHVIMPISKNYYKMLYNKLIYTGVSRAKKTLVLLGEEESLYLAINNDYSANRKTTLKEKIENSFAK